MKKKITDKNISNLAKIIINNDGNFSTMDFKKLNLPFELFLNLSLISKKDLLNNCKNILNL